MRKFFAGILLLVLMYDLAGCSAAQRYALHKNAELNDCAVKRMSMFGQQAYLQAYHDCHAIVNFQRFSAMNIKRQPEYGLPRSKDDALMQEVCWAFAKGLYIDKHYPELRIKLENRTGIKDSETQKLIEARNAEVKELSGSMGDVSKEILLEISEIMAGTLIIGAKTLCAPWKYHELEASIGQELRRRYPSGISSVDAARGDP
jgi:hypothetical protein